MKKKTWILVLVSVLCLLTFGMTAMAKNTPVPVLQGGSYSGIFAAEDGLLLADEYNKVIWKYGSSEGMILYAGQIGGKDLSGEPIGDYVDATRATAFFRSPWAIAPFLDGYAVSDPDNHVVRFLSETAVLTAVGSGKQGNQNGIGTKASFSHPTGLAAGSDGSLYIADTGNNCIRKLSKDGKVTTYLEGLKEPTGLCFQNGILYIADSGNHRICCVNESDGSTTVIAGQEEGYQDGAISKAKFSNPQGLVVAADGTVYIADTGNGAVRKLADGKVTTLVNAADEKTTWPVSPRGLCLVGDTLYVGDVFADTLFTISASGK